MCKGFLVSDPEKVQVASAGGSLLGSGCKDLRCLIHEDFGLFMRLAHHGLC